MVTFGTTVTQGYLDVPVSDFSSLTGRKPLSIQYIFEHVDDYLLGDRHPTELKKMRETSFFIMHNCE